MVVSDGRKGAEQFNRSAAINHGIRTAGHDVDVFIVAEADLLIPGGQVEEAEKLALEAPGLVVPFDRYCYLSPTDSEWVREHMDTTGIEPQHVMEHGASIGAVNVVSRETMDLVGQYDEGFTGCWYDDDAMKIAFEKLAGATRWVKGSGFHVYHLPGFKGDHLTAEDKAATAANKARLRRYKAAKTADRIRALTKGGQ
jgi:hypothetical protein